MKKKLLTTLLVLIIPFTLLVACGDGKNNDNQIVMGVSPGPYNELFDAAITPILEAEGYTVKNINFSALLESNIAMMEDSVDVVVAQHEGYMKVFNHQRGADLIAIQKIPTVPAALFSNQHNSLDAIEDNMTILIPQDASNAARAYGLLQKAGWITVKKEIEPMEVSHNDILDNPYNLTIKEIDSSLIPRVLDDADFGVIPGSMVWLGNMDPAKALLQEDLLSELFLQVVVRSKNRDAPWAKAIINAYQSEEFRAYMEKHNQNNYWILPYEQE